MDKLRPFCLLELNANSTSRQCNKCFHRPCNPKNRTRSFLTNNSNTTFVLVIDKTKRIFWHSLTTTYPNVAFQNKQHSSSYMLKAHWTPKCYSLEEGKIKIKNTKLSLYATKPILDFTISFLACLGLNFCHYILKTIKKLQSNSLKEDNQKNIRSLIIMALLTDF